MAKKQKQKGQAPQSVEEVKKKKKAVKKKKQFQMQIFLAGLMLMSVVFLPTAFLLGVGMLPFVVAYFTDKSEKKTKAITVGAMNLSACILFLMEMWTTDHSLDKAFAIVFDIVPLIVMYAGAAVGYLIDWAMTTIVANILHQRGLARMKSIEKRQAELVERWGKEVAGNTGYGEEPEETEEEKMKREIEVALEGN